MYIWTRSRCSMQICWMNERLLLVILVSTQRSPQHTLSYPLLPPQHLEQGLAQSRCSVNPSWMNRASLWQSKSIMCFPNFFLFWKFQSKEKIKEMHIHIPLIWICQLLKFAKFVCSLCYFYIYLHMCTHTHISFQNHLKVNRDILLLNTLACISWKQEHFT